MMSVSSIAQLRSKHMGGHVTSKNAERTGRVPPSRTNYLYCELFFHVGDGYTIFYT